jgi:hypothetical protein
MKQSYKIILASGLVIFTTQALANDYKTTVEYRHEYKDGNNKHADRVKAFLDTGKNIGFELDARYNNNDEDQMFDEMSMNGSELSIFYYDTIAENTTGLLGSSLDFNPDGLVYVPYIRVNHSFDNGFRIQARYKWKLWDYTQVNSAGDKYTSKIQEVDTWLGYKTEKWDFQYEFQIWNEMTDDAKPQFDNESYDYLHNFRIMYSISNPDGTKWRPFVEVGNVRQDSYSDNRQTRYRVGIKYTW